MGGGNHPHDPNTSDAPQPAGVLLFPHADVEPTVPGTTTYEQLGWTATGDLVGEKVPTGAIGGQQPVSGFLGNGLINTFTNGSDQAQGTLTSPQFTISQPYIVALMTQRLDVQGMVRGADILPAPAFLGGSTILHRGTPF